ncbi:MAG: glutathione S-transferase [Defluviicoccus sp.]|nr:glutathione S-transferase [Defluviicoccus sp.]MDE0386497.1 glutathione S-transferase [Defluviicoccus sp.]
MKGFSSPNSPFSRKVRVVAIETGQAETIDWTVVDLGGAIPALEATNPMGQVPAIVTDDGAALYDSAVICEYLDAQHDGTRLFPAGGEARWEALRLQALGDGLGVASAALAGERRRPEERRFQPFSDNQSGKIARSLARLEHDLAALDGTLTIAPIAAACAIGYMELRDCRPGWRDRHPALAAWYDRFAERPSMRATAPPPAR